MTSHRPRGDQPSQGVDARFGVCPNPLRIVRHLVTRTQSIAAWAPNCRPVYGLFIIAMPMLSVEA